MKLILIIGSPLKKHLLVLHPHFLKIGFVVAGDGVYSYHIYQGNKSDKERKNVRKKLSFMHEKDLIFFLRDGCNSVWVQFHVYQKKTSTQRKINQIFGRTKAKFPLLSPNTVQFKGKIEK